MVLLGLSELGAGGSSGTEARFSVDLRGERESDTVFILITAPPAIEDNFFILRGTCIQKSTGYLWLKLTVVVASV